MFLLIRLMVSCAVVLESRHGDQCKCTVYNGGFLLDIIYCFDPMRLKLGNPFKTMKIFCSNTKRFDNFSPQTRWMLRIMKV